jgi:hypothetical protein
MGRVGLRVGRLAAVALFLATGCQSSSGTSTSLWPWSDQKTALMEEYHAPPAGDPRYSEPPTYPKSTMQPKLKQPEPLDGTRGPPNRTGAGGMGGPLGSTAAGRF